MHVGSQRLLVGWISNLHGQYPEPVKGTSILFANVLGLLIGDHACVGATPLPWPKKTVFAIAVGHNNGVLQA